MSAFSATFHDGLSSRPSSLIWPARILVKRVYILGEKRSDGWHLLCLNLRVRSRGPSLVIARDALSDALKSPRSEGWKSPGVDAWQPGIRELLSALARFAMCRLRPQAANSCLCEVEVLSS